MKPVTAEEYARRRREVLSAAARFDKFGYRTVADELERRGVQGVSYTTMTTEIGRLRRDGILRRDPHHGPPTFRWVES